MGFWKDFFSNMDEPAIIIRTEERLEIPDEMFLQHLQHRKKPKQIGMQKAKQIEYTDADFKLIE